MLLPAQRLQTHELHAGRRAARDGRACRPPTPAASLATPDDVQRHRRPLLATPRGAREAAAVLHLLAGGQGARRVHDRARACSPSSRRRSPRPWSRRPRAFLNAPARPRRRRRSRTSPSRRSRSSPTRWRRSTASRARGTSKLVDARSRRSGSGIFTLPARDRLALGPDTTRLVKRGVFFTRKVMCLPLGQPPPGRRHHDPATADGTERQKVESVTADRPCCRAATPFINPFGFMQENYDPIGRWRTTDQGLPIDASISVNFLDEGPLTDQHPGRRAQGLHRLDALQAVLRPPAVPVLHGPRRDCRPTIRVLRQMFFGFANNDEQDIVAAAARARDARPASLSARRRHDPPGSRAGSRAGT